MNGSDLKNFFLQKFFQIFIGNFFIFSVSLLSKNSKKIPTEGCIEQLIEPKKKCYSF